MRVILGRFGRFLGTICCYQSLDIGSGNIDSILVVEDEGDRRQLNAKVLVDAG